MPGKWSTEKATEYEISVAAYTDEQLYAEHIRLKSQLERRDGGQPYPRRHNRKQRAGDLPYVPPENKKYCICQREDDGRRYLACDTCDSWFHPECVLSPQQVAEGRSVGYDNMGWVCNKCKINQSDTYSPSRSPTRKRKSKQESRHNSKRIKSNGHKDDFVFPSLGRNNSRKRKREFDDDHKRIPKPKQKPKKRKTPKTIIDDDDSDYPYSPYVPSVLPSSVSHSPIHDAYSTGDMQKLLEDIIKGEKKLAIVKLTREYTGELEQQKHVNHQLQGKVDELEEDCCDLRNKTDTLQNSEKFLKVDLEQTRNALDTARRKHKQRLAESRDKWATMMESKNDEIRVIKEQLSEAQGEVGYGGATQNIDHRLHLDAMEQLEKQRDGLIEERDRALLVKRKADSERHQMKAIHKDLQRDILSLKDKLRQVENGGDMSDQLYKAQQKHKVESSKYQSELPFNKCYDAYMIEKEFSKSLEGHTLGVCDRLQAANGGAGKKSIAAERKNLDKNRKLQSKVKNLEDENKALKKEIKLKDEALVKHGIQVSSNLTKEVSKKKKTKRKNHNNNTHTSQKTRPPLQENTTVQTQQIVQKAKAKLVSSYMCRLCAKSKIDAFEMLVCASLNKCRGGAAGDAPVSYHTRCSKKKKESGLDKTDGKWYCRACRPRTKKAI